MTDPTNVGRGRARARRTILAITTALCTGLAAPALARSPHPNLDANGVDLTDGTYTLRLPVASLGSGQTELALVAYDGQSDNWSNIWLQHIAGTNGGISQYLVVTGTTTDYFATANSSSTRGTGATLTSVGTDMIYRTLEGVEITFSNPAPSNGAKSNMCDAYNTTDCTLLPSLISGKSGMGVSVVHDIQTACADQPDPEVFPECTHIWRVASVSNSAGYSINWSYLGGPLIQGPDWIRRTTAELKNGSTTVGTVTYAISPSGYYTITTPGGKTWGITGGYPGIVAIRRPGASSDTTTITAYAGQVSSITRDGVTTNYSRSVSGNTATMVVTDAQSNATTIVSDMDKYRPTSVTDPLSRTTTMAYDSIGRPTEVTYPEGNKTQYTYDSRGNVIETRLKAKPSVGGSDIVTTAGYASTCSDPSCNSPQWTKDANGNQTDYAYDTTNGLPIAIAAPPPTSGANRPETRFSYTTLSGVQMVTGVSICRTGISSSCVGTADEVKQSIGYDANLNTATVTMAAGDNSLSATVGQTYDSAGNLVTSDGPLSGSDDTTTWRWSADREQLGAISPDPDGSGSLPRRAVKSTYNADGQPTIVELGTVTGTGDTDWMGISSAQQVTSTYDANARKTKDVLTAGGTTYSVSQTSYDAVGRVQCVAQRMNPAAFGSVPASACSLGTAGSHGPDRISETSYDAAGLIIKTTSAQGTADQADEATTSYSNNGRVTAVIDAEHNKTNYSYDGFDRLLTTYYPSTTKGAGTSSLSDYEQLMYDSASNITGRRLRDGNSIGYTYDANSRMTFKDLPGSEPDVTVSYDLLARPLSIASSAQTLALGYDALNRLTSQSGPLGTVTSQYDLAGRRTRLTWPDAMYVAYDHLTTGEIKTVRENGATSGVGVLAIYSYDNLGWRTGVTNGNGTSSSYTIDPVARLGTLGHDLLGSSYDVSWSLGYNAASQIVTKTRSNDGYAFPFANASTATTTNGLNQATVSGSVGVGYDTRGNTNSIGMASYGYTSENLLTSGPSSAALVYDPALRLYQTTGSVTTRFQYDGLDLIGEYDASSALQRRYVFGSGVDEPIVWYEGSGTSARRWLHADERGSVVAVTDSTGGTIAINKYDEYGQPVPGNAGRFGYTGQTWLPELGQWYYKARIYAPGLGRFMQTDPIGYGDGINWYNYVGSDPVNRRDPTGECEDTEPCEVVVTAKKLQDEAARPSGSGLGFALLSLISKPWSALLHLVWSSPAEAPAPPWTPPPIAEEKNRLDHMFVDRKGHFRKDTQANRKMIQDTVKPKNYVHTKFENHVYRRIISTGQQVWVNVRHGVITEAGINEPNDLR